MSHNRQKYLDAIKAALEPNIFAHSLALESCMAGLYDYLNFQGQLGPADPPRDDWTLAGLIHDIDYGGEFKDQHPHKTKEALAKYNLDIGDSVFQTVKAHAAPLTGVQLQTKADWAIFCADSLTGLITAVALILPSKKLADVKLSSVVKRFLKEPKFAAGTRRNEVAMCSKPEGLNMPLEKFIEICLDAMKGIAQDIGL